MIISLNTNWEYKFLESVQRAALHGMWPFRPGDVEVYYHQRLNDDLVLGLRFPQMGELNLTHTFAYPAMRDDTERWVFIRNVSLVISELLRHRPRISPEPNIILGDN